MGARPARLLRDHLLEGIVAGPGGCWIWNKPSPPSCKGYVNTSRDGRRISVHRAAYEEFVGPIPAGMTIDHVCHTRDLACPGGPTCLHRRCLRPDHLEPVTSGVNTLRGRGVAARYRAAATCVNDHEFTRENTRIRRNGTRECRACRRDRKRSARERARTL